jgi:hypothetical protein
VARWSPDGETRTLGVLMIDLSGPKIPPSERY